MAVKIVPKGQVSDQFMAFEVHLEGIPTRVVSVSLDALADGLITIEGEVAKATEQAEARLKRVLAAEQAMKGLS